MQLRAGAAKTAQQPPTLSCTNCTKLKGVQPGGTRFPLLCSPRVVALARRSKSSEASASRLLDPTAGRLHAMA